MQSSYFSNTPAFDSSESKVITSLRRSTYSLSCGVVSLEATNCLSDTTNFGKMTLHRGKSISCGSVFFTTTSSTSDDHIPVELVSELDNAMESSPQTTVEDNCDIAQFDEVLMTPAQSSESCSPDSCSTGSRSDDENSALFSMMADDLDVHWDSIFGDQPVAPIAPMQITVETECNDDCIVGVHWDSVAFDVSEDCWVRPAHLINTHRVARGRMFAFGGLRGSGRARGATSISFRLRHA